MRVAMPLFEFQYIDSDEFKEFMFSDGRLSLRRFTDAQLAADGAGKALFSEQDRDHINLERFALVAESSILKEEVYRQDVSLLLMAFRILGDRITPWIKFRLSHDADLCSRLDETEHHIRLPRYLYQVYTDADFPLIDKAYMMLRDAEHVSTRVKNALFFLYKAFYSVHWLDGFLFCMNALEALFSLDRGGSATETICRRTSALLGDPTNWSNSTIKDLYRIRSDITHGRIEASPNSEDNLRLSEKMERVTKLCFRKLIAIDAFKHFATPSSRHSFLESL